MKRLFGTDGVRGIANEYLTPELALAIGRALGKVLYPDISSEKPKIIVGADTRISSDMLVSAVCAGLTSMGCDCYLLGTVPTPAVAYLIGKTEAKAGVMISASHNTYNYNGIKIFNDEGFKLSDELEERIEMLIDTCNLSAEHSDPESIGRVYNAGGLVKDYAKHITDSAPCDLSGLRIVFDCSNGSASATASMIFGNLGAECDFISSEPDGININAGCGSTHLESLAKYVADNKYDVGIAFDGDADRCLAIDECGNEVDGDFIMAILSRAMKAKGTLKKNTVVGTIMTNYGFSKFCEANGINFLATKVGDRYVLENIELGGYSFGGEQSGHVILRDYATTGDGQLTARHLISELAKSGKTLSELASVMKKYPQCMINVSASPLQKSAFFTDEDIKAVIDETEDALVGHGRLVIRPSGTEPLVRIMIEDKDPILTDTLCRQTAEKIEKLLSKYAD